MGFPVLNIPDTLLAEKPRARAFIDLERDLHAKPLFFHLFFGHEKLFPSCNDRVRMGKCPDRQQLFPSGCNLFRVGQFIG